MDGFPAHVWVKYFLLTLTTTTNTNRRTPPRRDWAYILFPHKVKVLLQLIYVKPQFLGKCGQISVQWNIKEIFCFAVRVCGAVHVRGEALLSATLRYTSTSIEHAMCCVSAAILHQVWSNCTKEKLPGKITEILKFSDALVYPCRSVQARNISYLPTASRYRKEFGQT